MYLNIWLNPSVNNAFTLQIILCLKVAIIWIYYSDNLFLMENHFICIYKDNLLIHHIWGNLWEYEVVWVYKTQQFGSFRTLLRFPVFFIIITTLSLLRGNKSNFYFLWIREREKAIPILPKWNMAIIISYRVAYKRLFQLMKVKLNKNLRDCLLVYNFTCIGGKSSK